MVGSLSQLRLAAAVRPTVTAAGILNDIRSLGTA